jgi:prepilin signal peptidase PulO-like enzyme (type II secretory pathway)
LIALVIAWLFPLTAMPYSETVTAGPGVPAELRVASLRFDYPGFDPLVAMISGNGGFVGDPNANPAAEGVSLGPVWITRSGPDWAYRHDGLIMGLGIIWLWCFALVPKTIVLRYGFANMWRFMWASMLRPPRKTKPKKKFRVAPRRSLPLTRLLVLIWIVVTILLLLAWLRGGPQWIALLSAVVGLGFGGLTVWTVRILGSLAMQREAMGFGDVTLLAMIGAFLGWQASFLTFALAPFAAIFLAVGQYVLTRRNELAFGPYLCLGAVILIFSWRWLWNGWAGPSVFVMGTTLLWILAVSLVLLYAMLAGWRWIAYR